MLGPIGKTAKALLTSAGYRLDRPTRFERTLVRSIWADWLGKDPHLFADVYARNRELLRSVKQWVDPADLEHALWRYGVGPEWDFGSGALGETSLNEVEPEVTYADLIGFIGKAMEPLRYLEIGVSVGKNFLQIARQFPDAEVYGLDVEDLNPRIAKEFDRVETVWQSDREYEVATRAGGTAKIRLTHQKLHRKDGVPVTYIKGDQFSDDTWNSLKGTQFNLIFSDGVHTGHALRDELAKLSHNDLLDVSGRFAMYWDDLINLEMQTAFTENAADLGKRIPDGWFGMHHIHGTYGPARLNGIFANFRL